jgi:hypothetical protein
MLSDAQMTRFMEDGFVHLPGAFPRPVADECRAILWHKTGCDPDDPATWTRPVVRIGDCAEAPFRQAANTPVLHQAFDQLVGVGRWFPRPSLGGFPIRFPHPDEPGDTGWHVEGSYLPDGEQDYWVNLWSRDRALLMLFLFSDVGRADAPTRIKVGSHLDVPPFLLPAGQDGMPGATLAQTMDQAGKLNAPDRPLALATGAAGDVYLCHPFLVHAAQPHHGSSPRFMAQPPLHPKGPLDLDRPDDTSSPVERGVRHGLDLDGHNP